MRKNRPRGQGYTRKSVTLAAYDWQRLEQIMEAMTDGQGNHPSRAAIISEAVEKLWISRVQYRKPSPTQVGIEAMRRMMGKRA